ncbi:UNVERIFIED_CONTAM: hypothetical protein NCL1_50897 [Trichonephila clavipes]
MLEENIHYLSDETFRYTAESNFILQTLVEVLEAGELIDPKKDSLKNDALTKDSTVVWNPEDASMFPSITIKANKTRPNGKEWTHTYYL